MEAAPAPNKKLEEARQHMLSLTMHAGEVQRACGLDIVPEDFCNGALKFGLMEVSCVVSFLFEALLGLQVLVSSFNGLDGLCLVLPLSNLTIIW